MSLWNKVKGAAKSVKCMTNWHAGQFTPIEGKPKCHLEKTCPDCNKYVTKKSHKFGEWSYVRADRCDRESSCIHCDDKKHDIKHNHQMVRKELGTCREILECARCRDEKMGNVSHNFKLVGKDSSTCEPIKECTDCGVKTKERAQHDWISIGSVELKVKTQNGSQRKCRTCGTMG